MTTKAPARIRIARLCKNIHQEWTLGWYVGVQYDQIKGERQALINEAHEMGITHLFVDFAEKATPIAEVV